MSGKHPSLTYRDAGVDVQPLQWPALDPWRFDRRVAWDQIVLPVLAARSGATVLHAASGTMPWVSTLPVVVTVHGLDVRQALAVEHLHHEERLAGVGLPGIEHLDDVRALDRRDGPCLSVEAPQGVGAQEY